MDFLIDLWKIECVMHCWIFQFFNQRFPNEKWEMKFFQESIFYELSRLAASGYFFTFKILMELL